MDDIVEPGISILNHKILKVDVTCTKIREIEFELLKILFSTLPTQDLLSSHW